MCTVMYIIPKTDEISFCDQLMRPNVELPVGWFSFGSSPGCWRIVMGNACGSGQLSCTRSLFSVLAGTQQTCVQPEQIG